MASGPITVHMRLILSSGRRVSNIPTAGKAGIALLFAFVHHGPALAEPRRWAYPVP
jgi:hypothetical protein